MSKQKITAAVLSLVLMILACNLPLTATPTALPTDEVETPDSLEETATALPTFELPIEPSPTAEPDTETERGCTLNAAFVADVTIPDNSVMTAGQSFRKTWRLRNSGTCEWETGTLFVFVSGDAMNGPPNIAVPQTAPQAQIDLSVDFQAPAEPGTYRSNWRLQAPDGTRYGVTVYVKIVVPGPTETPTLTPSPTVTLTPTPTSGAVCTPPDAQFTSVAAQAQALGFDLGCARSAPRSLSGAFQEYWANIDHPNPHMQYRGLMLWRSDTSKIYVIRGQDTTAYEALITSYDDTFREGDPDIPAACATMTIPTGYLMPIRGFGKLWCAQSLWETLGWPRMAESAVNLTIQEMDRGLLIRVVGAPGGVRLIALEWSSGRATVYLVP